MSKPKRKCLSKHNAKATFFTLTIQIL